MVNKTYKPSTTIQSVSRAAAVLKLIATADTPPTPRSLSDVLGLTMPTTYHLVATLESEGLVTRGAHGALFFGPAATLIANAVNASHLVSARQLDALRWLADQTGEQVYLSAWSMGTIQVMESIESRHVVSVNTLKVGYAEHIHARASAKVLLADAPQSLRNSVLDMLRFPKLTKRTIGSLAEFERELENVRQSEIAFDNEEFAEGVMCASVPVRIGGATVACITVSAPSMRFKPHFEDLVRDVRRAGREASE